MMKLRMATGLGSLLFMAAMVGGPAGMSQAQDDQGVTLASLAGNFAGRGGGFVTLCFSPGFLNDPSHLLSCSSVSPVPTPAPYNETHIWQQTRDAAGKSCGVFT